MGETSMTPIERQQREYLPKARSKYRAWRFWQSLWRWTNFMVGGSATVLSAIIAANIENAFLDSTLAVALASANGTSALSTSRRMRNGSSGARKGNSALYGRPD
jgi:hypothetical protein